MKYSKLFALILLLFFVSGNSSAMLLNFDTRADGTAYSGLGGSFPENEYLADYGLNINDNDPNVGFTQINQTNSANIGTDISGYYLNVGAFLSGDRTGAELTLTFSGYASDVELDFADPDGEVLVKLLDDVIVLDEFTVTGTEYFLNQAGYPVQSGHADLTAYTGFNKISLYAGDNQAFIVDNLEYDLARVPEPVSLVLLSSGLLLMKMFRENETI